MARHPSRSSAEPCPCGGGPKSLRYAACCEPFLRGEAVPSTAEQLMRSRYTAYTRGETDYLLATWHASTRPARAELDNAGTTMKWLGLSVHSHTQSDDTHAHVTFTARYRDQGRGHRMQECSRFVREDGRWFYVDGDVADS